MDSIFFFFDSDEESNDLQLRNHRRAIRGKELQIFELSDTEFYRNFRLNKLAFDYVLKELKEYLPIPTKSSSLSVEMKLAAFLRFLAEGSYQHGVAQDLKIGIAQSTFSGLLAEVLDVLERTLCPKWITVKMTESEKREARLYFMEKCRIPGIVMCVDGTHIKIQKPNRNAHLHYNRKGYYSLNAMVVCDHRLKIRYINAQHPGATHDSFVWKNSAVASYFKSIYDNGDNYSRILGDSGYPLQPWLITPFRRTESDSPEANFNKSHSSGRNVVERTIGAWKNWCRCLLGARQLHYTPKKAVQIINVAAALHNIRLHFNVDQEELAELDIPTEQRDEERNNMDDDDDDDRYAAEARRIRNEILQNFI